MKAASARDGGAAKAAATHSGLAPKAAETKQAASYRQSRSRAMRPQRCRQNACIWTSQAQWKGLCKDYQRLLKRQLNACYSRVSPLGNLYPYRWPEGL